MSESCWSRVEVGGTREECEAECDADGFCVSAFSDPGRRFRYFPERLPYDEAKETCASMGMRLASVRDEREQREIGGLLLPFAADTLFRGWTAADGVAPLDMKASEARSKDYLLMNNAWLGLEAEAGKRFQWSDPAADPDPGSSGGGRYGWGVGQPSRTGAGRKCGAMVRNMWNDWNCDHEMGFVCETAPKCEVVSCGKRPDGARQVSVASPFLPPLSSAQAPLPSPTAPQQYALPAQEVGASSLALSAAEREGRISRGTTVATLLLDKLEDDPRLGPGIKIASEILNL